MADGVGGREDEVRGQVVHHELVGVVLTARGGAEQWEEEGVGNKTRGHKSA